VKRALITGITGQDGSYLAELLLLKGYEVHGVKRRTSTFNTSRIEHLYRDPHEEQTGLYLHHGDLNDTSSLVRIINKVAPDEIYNLAAQSHVGVSFEEPEYTANAGGLGTLRILETLRNLKLENVKFYQASTSELFGNSEFPRQNELTPFIPRSPYAVAKLYSYWITVNYREAFGIFASNGILFNHESPRRGETFVSRKITRGLAAIKMGVQEKLYLGNLDAQRDWGHASDYVKAMWMMMQHDSPIDLVIATGTSNSVRKFVELSAQNLDIEIIWRGQGANEKGIDAQTGKVLVEVDSRYFRPNEVDFLCGDYSKALSTIGWKPQVSFADLVTEMTLYDLELLQSKLK
jgi:GDPmannose 4,6-dehydratase